MDLLPLPPELQQAITKDGFEAVRALASCVYKACGQLLLPWQIVRVAHAESKAELIKSEAKANSIKTIGQAISEYPELAISFNGNLEELNINNTDFNSLETRANIRINQQKLRKQKNLENVVGKAYNELIGKKIDSNAEIDEDVIIRLFDDAENISDEQVQTLWAKILAGEILVPQSYSLRFLDFLRNISKKDLDLILKIMPFISDNFIFNYDKILSKYGVNYELILKLDKIGILNSIGTVSLDYDLDETSKPILFKTQDIICVIKNSSTYKRYINIPVYSVSEIGVKLQKLSNTNINLDFIKDSLTYLSEENKDVCFSLNKIQSIKDNRIFCDDNPIFEIIKKST